MGERKSSNSKYVGVYFMGLWTLSSSDPSDLKQVDAFPCRLHRVHGLSSLHLFFNCIHDRQAAEALDFDANRRASLISFSEN